MTPFRVNTVIIVNPKSSEVIGVGTFSKIEDAKRFMDRYEPGETDSDLYLRVSKGSESDWIDELGNPRPIEIYKKRGTYFVTIPYEDRYTDKSINLDLENYRQRDRQHKPKYTEPLEDMQDLNPYESADMARLRKN